MAQNYIDHRVSHRVSSQFRRIVQGRTEIVPLLNGAEARNSAWAHKRMRYAANYPLLSRDAQIEIVSAFYAADAQRLLFRFKDHGDYKATNAPLNVVAGTATPVQLTKRYTFGSASFDRRVQAIVSATVKDGGGATVAGTLDSALGTFTPAGPWGGGAYTWSGEFDVWVRFASDDFDVTMETLGLAVTDVELIECLAVRTA